MKTISFIIHGKHSGKKKLKVNLEKTFSNKFNCVFAETTLQRNAITLTKKAIEDKSDYVIICGGDGSVNEAVNGFMLAGQQKEAVLGILPIGTGNDFVKSAGISGELLQLQSLIEDNQIMDIDVGEVIYQSKTGEEAKRYFVNITDIGIGGWVVKHVNEGSRILGPDLTYLSAILKSFLFYKAPKVKIKAGDFSWEGPIVSFNLANGKYYGSGLCIAPDAVLTDGELDLVLIGNVSMLEFIKYQSRIKKGLKINHKEVKYSRARECTIENVNGNLCPIDMDGEFIGYPPMKVRLLPGALRILGNC